MANPFGWAALKADRPEMWYVDGYVPVTTDGYANPVWTNVPNNIINTSVAASVSHPSTGHYVITFQENWADLESCEISSVIPVGLSPQYLSAQKTGFNVSGASPWTISWIFNVSGTPTDLPAGSGFMYSIRLKQSGAY
jgi:hypothetical protein